MRVQFMNRQGGPENLVCDAELVFDSEGPLAGMKLVGFALWRNAEGEVNVTFPARAFASSGERRFFDYLRAADPGSGDHKRVKEWILEEFRASRRNAA